MSCFFKARLDFLSDRFVHEGPQVPSAPTPTKNIAAKSALLRCVIRFLLPEPQSQFCVRVKTGRDASRWQPLHVRRLCDECSEAGTGAAATRPAKGRRGIA